MSENLELLVVVINYKTPELTINCLDTILPQLNPRQRVAVVDNFSNDGSVEKLQAWIAGLPQNQVKLICSTVNSGFSGGNNLGMRSATADFYLLLNSDTLLRDGCLVTLLETAHEHPDAGIVSPRLEWPNGEGQISCFRYHTAFSELILAARTDPITKLLRRWDLPYELSDQESYPQWTSFACILLRNEALQEVGYMDEGYFLYYEDADYCHLLEAKGWRILNNPKARVVHLRGGSSDVKKNISRRARVPRYYYASRTRYFRKHYGKFGHLLANIAWTMGRSVSLLREVVSGRETPVSEGQWIDIWVNTFRPFKPYISDKHE